MAKEGTGERLETFVFNETTIEHLHRYAIAMELAKGKKVLDIACGEGYGSNLLASVALHVTGIDIDQLTINKAKEKYNKENIIFEAGSILNIHVEDQSIDVITCFETLEHLTEHDKILTEIKRVLKPGGVLIISTPEKSNYSDPWQYKNPFHKKELYEKEFKHLINKHFSFNFFYRQQFIACSIIQHENSKTVEKYYYGNEQNIKTISSIIPMYWVAIASDIDMSIDLSSIFHAQINISQLINEEVNSVKRTMTYRIGHIILFPLKFIKSIFK